MNLEMTSQGALAVPGSIAVALHLHPHWDAMITAWIGDRMSALPPAESGELGGAAIFRAAPPGHDPSDRRIYLDIHGGAFICGGGELVGTMARVAAFRVNASVVAVVSRRLSCNRERAICCCPAPC